jgi:hypothetical protein
MFLYFSAWGGLTERYGENYEVNLKLHWLCLEHSTLLACCQKSMKGSFFF